jgi:hypothetical protein
MKLVFRIFEDGSEIELKYCASSKGLIPRALFVGERRIISPVSFELRPLE